MMIDHDIVNTKIPLNPPLTKGEFTPPFDKGRLGGIFTVPFKNYNST